MGGEFCVLGQAVSLERGVIIDHGCIVESDVKIGENTLLCYRAHVCADSQIGQNCVIGGFIGERSVIANNSRIFGSLVHSHPKGWRGWDDDDQMAMGPRIGCSVLVAFGAVIVGQIEIGDGVYIGANAVVCGDVPSGTSVAPASLWQPSRTA
jgi:UDP-3-O-[3-hydroxymyristoyl] glucosamine N-acyltransferase